MIVLFLNLGKGKWLLWEGEAGILFWPGGFTFDSAR